VNRGKMDMIKLLEIEWLWGKKKNRCSKPNMWNIANTCNWTI